jgi:hypothetical protein
VYYTIKGTVAGTRKLIVTWYQVCHFGGGANDAVTFQVQLDEATGKISMFYPYVHPANVFISELCPDIVDVRLPHSAMRR